MEPIKHSNTFKTYALGDLGAIKRGAMPASAGAGAEDAVRDTTLFITPDDLNGKKWLHATKNSLHIAEQGATPAALLPARTIVICAESGRVAMTAKPGICSQEIDAVIVDESRYNAEFIYYSLAVRQDELKAALSISAAPITHQKYLANLQILLPPRKVQDMVIAILSHPDTRVLCKPDSGQSPAAQQRAIFKSWFIDFAPIKAKIAANKEWLSLQPTHESASSVCYAAELEDAEKDFQDYLSRAAMRAISGKTYGELNQLPPEQFERLAAVAALFPATLSNSTPGKPS